MADAFIGEVRLFPYNYVPENDGWVLCAGQPLSVQTYTPLFAILGTTFGGDGKNTFNLPNLQGVVVMGQGQGPGLTNRQIQQNPIGAEEVALTSGQMPNHSHTLTAANVNAVAGAVPANNYLAKGVVRVGPQNKPIPMYNPATSSQTQLNAAALTPFLGSGVTQTQGQPHENRQPVLAMMYCICAQGGVFPVRPT